MRDTPIHLLPRAVRDMPLIVGLPVISRLGRVIVHGASDALYIFPAEADPVPFVKSRTGLVTVALPQSGWRVVHVAKASPAATAGWKVGELIAEIDGKTIEPPRQPAINHAPGSQVRFKMADGSFRILTREDYY